MTSNSTVARARAMRGTLTPPEARLWVALRRLRGDGCHFRRQVPFRGYFLDFACHARRLALEVDGMHHGEVAQARHDAERDAILAREGYRTLRFAAADVLGDLEGVVAAIRLALERDGGVRSSGAARHAGVVGGGTSPGAARHSAVVGCGTPPGAARHPPHEGRGIAYGKLA